MPERFAFEFAGPYRRPLGLLGVRPETAAVLVDRDSVVVEYGPWRLRTTPANVADATVVGPFRWWRAIGPHLSLADRGVTFGTSTRRGVCLLFRSPVGALLPGGWLRHPGATVTVADPEGLVAALRAAGSAAG